MANKVKMLSFLFFVIIIGGVLISCKGGELLPQKGKIFVNDIELLGEYAQIYFESNKPNECRNAELPFIAILKAYGFESEWVDDSHAKLLFKNKIYHLYLTSVEMIEEETGADLIVPVPGSKRSYTIADRELYLDYINVKGFMALIGENVRINVNSNTYCVNVYF